MSKSSNGKKLFTVHIVTKPEEELEFHVEVQYFFDFFITN